MAKAPVKDPADPGPDTQLHLIYAGFAIFGTLWVAVQLGNLLSSPRQQMPINPISIAVNMVKGTLRWPAPATVIVIAIVLAALAWQLWKRRQKANASKGRLAVDDKADHMGSGDAIKSLTAAGVMEKAEQIGVPLERDGFRGAPYIPGSLMRPGDPIVPGVPIGVSVADGVTLYGSYEDLHVDIWGPRQGKTTSRVIPAILSAVGPVLVTSNKRDVVDATRDVRQRKGSPVWVFDPQGVAGEPPSWFWDPLAWVNPRRPGYDARAASLAGHFADGGDYVLGSDSKGDTYFDQEAEELLAALFLAAAVAGRWITQVWDWVTNPLDTEPIEILRHTERFDIPSEFRGGYHFVASGLAQQYNTDPRTISGIFGTAKKMINSIKLSNMQPWITPGSGPQFDEEEFITSNGTLYCLSLEGRGTAGPLVSAFIEAVIDIAIRKAAQSPRGRLPVPLLAVLDEAANVVRWKDLPRHYSHFGSRGIVVMTVLQSWAQGVRCWGAEGMEALWAASNIKVLGSGVDDVRFLQERVEAIGEYDSISSSVSESKGGKSYSRSLGSSKTFNVHGLATLPRGRAIVFSSATPAVLVKSVPWWEGDFSDAVRESIEAHEPAPYRKTRIDDLIGERVPFEKSTPTYDESGTIEEAKPL
ncbi:TraM recognition domain-containing protein [Nocardia sp. ET3-3]|uniref:TraM recognition domain-containing protein n=1 Tax=Nocardia terrae TaxID=2675851 RepID=A0A7K1UU62_9NOCA|nr:TraM recognition domain-containing protein [Nocardia terrae]MVU77821.1 TraM recognition domain-containing protein [Nocardia terrae]